MKDLLDPNYGKKFPHRSPSTEEIKKAHEREVQLKAEREKEKRLGLGLLLPEDVPDFECPICSCKTFTANPLYANRGPVVYGPGSGHCGPVGVKDFVCDGCSAIFMDPRKFSKNRQPENPQEAA